jgi:hypothetical protein
VRVVDEQRRGLHRYGGQQEELRWPGAAAGEGQQACQGRGEEDCMSACQHVSSMVMQ